MKLIRKEFLLRENLQMMDIAGEDALLTWCMVCAAEKYVIIPNVTYIYRIHDESVTHNSDNNYIENRIKKWLRAMTLGFKYLDEFLNRKNYFRKNLDAKYLVLDALVKEFAAYFFTLYAQIPMWQLDEIIRRELKNFSDTKALMAFLFNRMNIFNLKMNQQGAIIQQQQAMINELQRQLRS